MLRIVPLAAVCALLSGAIGDGAIGFGTCDRAIYGADSTAASPIFDTGDPETLALGVAALAGASSCGTLTTASGIVLTPEVCLRGQDATGDNWDDVLGAATFTRQGSGDDITAGFDAPYPGESAPDFGAVDPSSGDCFRAAENVGSVDGDKVIALWVRDVDESFGSPVILAKNTNYNSQGWNVFASSNGFAMNLRISDSSSSVTSTLSDATPNSWNLYVFVIDEDDSVRGYTNGVLNDDDSLAALGSMDTSDVLSIGGHSGDTSTGFGGQIGGIWIYDAATFSGGATTNTEADEVAQLISCKLFGSCLDTPTDGAPTVATRASTAYQRKCDPDGNTVTYHLMGKNIPRRETSCGYTWDNPTSSETEVASYLGEPTATNLALQSEDISTTWTAINATINVDQHADPSGRTTLDDIDGTGTGEHGVSQAVTLTAASHTIAAVFRPGGQTFAYLDVSTLTNVSAYFDSSDCQPDTVGASATAYGYDLGNNLCLVAISYTGTAASHTHRLLCAASDGGKSYAGAVGDCSFGWASVTALDYPSSYVATTTATVTRSPDVLYYDALDWSPGVSGGTVLADFYEPRAAWNSWKGIFEVNQNDGSGERWILSPPNSTQARFQVLDITNGTTNANASKTGGSLPGRNIVRGWGEENGTAYVDINGSGSPASANIADTVGTNLNRVRVGSLRAGTDSGGQSYYRATVYDAAIAPGEQGTGDDTP